VRVRAFRAVLKPALERVLRVQTHAEQGFDRGGTTIATGLMGTGLLAGVKLYVRKR